MLVLLELYHHRIFVKCIWTDTRGPRARQRCVATHYKARGRLCTPGKLEGVPHHSLPRLDYHHARRSVDPFETYFQRDCTVATSHYTLLSSPRINQPTMADVAESSGPNDKPVQVKLVLLGKCSSFAFGWSYDQRRKILPWILVPSPD